nr:7795_t:CDS:2 [Entrophospora candida]
MANTQSKINLLEEQNSKLVAEITELRKKYSEIEAENIELKQTLKDYEVRFVNLEQNDKEKTIHIAKLGDEIKEIKQSSVNTIPTKMANSDISGQVISQNKDVPASDITDNASISDELNNAPNSDVSFEDKEIKFLEQNVSEEPISQTQSTISSEIKIPYNQKVEQGLIHELFEFIRGTDFMSLQELKKTLLNSIFIKQISDIPVDIDLPQVPEEYEKKVSNLSSEKNISDQMSRTQIYDEMMQYLPGIKREYLHKMTQKARTIYTLFNGIGKDKIEYITYSVDAISSLTSTQIQNIINLYTEELDAKVSLSESQKLIGMKNSSHAHDQSKSDIETKVCKEILSETKVSLPTTSSIQSSHTSNSEDKINEDVKSLPETKVNTSANSTHDCSYFCNKILEQYPDLYYEFSSENVDYYGITAETLCPLCELNHEEGVEGRYETGSYYIKCEQHEIEITA